MKISREGVTFKYKGFSIIYRWPLLQTYFFQKRFLVEELGYDSNSLLECLGEIVKPNKPLKSNGHYQKAKKVTGFDTYDLAMLYGSIFFAESCGVVLTDINVIEKSFDFWQKIPIEYKREFLKDAVYLKCNNPKEVERLIDSLPASFCDAQGFVNGGRYLDNLID